MANLTKPSIHDTPVDPKSLTEQEHKNSCDINLLINKLKMGQQIMGGPPGVYGYDDTTQTGHTHRITMANLEAELSSAAENVEFTEDEIKLIPEHLQKKFGFKTKAKNEQTKVQQHDDSNNNKLDQPQNTKEPDKTKKTSTP